MKTMGSGTRITDTPVKAWKHQLHNSMSIFETLAEGSIRVRESQLKTATELHEQMDTARKLLEEATDPREVFQIQQEWFSATLDRSFSLWTDMTKVAAETQTKCVRFLFDSEVPFVTPASGLPQASKSAFGFFDEAYKRWRDTSIQIYAAAERAADTVIEPVIEAAEELATAGSSGEKTARGTARKNKQDE